MVTFSGLLNDIKGNKQQPSNTSKNFNVKQNKGLINLNKQLVKCSEDELRKCPVNDFVKELVKLVDDAKGYDDRLRILAFKPLAILFNLFPSSSCDALVDIDGLASILDIWTTIDKIKPANAERQNCVQMFLEVLEKISKKHPTVCLKAGVLERMLLFYNSLKDLEAAHSIAMNMCKEVTDDDTKFVTNVVPSLLQYLKNCDAKVVELALIYLSDILKGFESLSVNLDETLCNHELIKQISCLISPRVSGGGQASLNTSNWMGLVFVVKTCAKNSHLGSQTFTDIIDTVKEVLTDAGIHPACSRPAPQIFAIVNVANELLPPLPKEQDDSNRTEISARAKLLAEQPKLLQKFGLDLLPALIQICKDGASASVPRECLSVIAKLMYYSSTDTIDSLSIRKPISSFLAGVLTWKDPLVLSHAVLISKILMDKQPKIFSKIFEKEGVMQAMRALKESGYPATDFPPLSSQEESFENSYLLQLKDLCSQLIKVDTGTTRSDGSHDDEGIGIISKILEYLNKDITTFELIDSGVVDSFLNYLSCGVCFKENISESLMDSYRKKAMKRWESFITIALPPGCLQDMEVPPISTLLKMLQSALSSLESFPLMLIHRSSCGNADLSSGLSSLHEKVNLRLCKADGEKSLKSLIVPFHPLKTFADVEEFLWPLVKGDESEERTDRHLASPRLMFFQGGKELIPNMSIYEAVQRFVVNEIGTNRCNGESRIWDNTYDITYQNASRPRVSVETIGSTSPSKSKQEMSPVNLSEQQISIMNSILCAQLALDLEKSNPTYKIMALLRLLERLHKQFQHEHARAKNNAASFSSKEFINEGLTSKLQEQITDALALYSKILPSWCYQLTKTCPFLFAFETRRQYFYSTALGLPRALYYLQQQQGVPERRDINHGGLITRRHLVSRDCVLDFASKILKVKSNLETVLQVNFVGQVDPGLTSTTEFYALISRHLQKSGLGMWRFDYAFSNSVMKVDEKTRKGITCTTFDDLIHAPLGLFPLSWSTDADVLVDVTFKKVLEHFDLLGRVLAKAIQDKRLISLPLSSAFYRLLLGQDLDLHDIVSFDPELGQRLLKMQGVEKGSCETERFGHDYVLHDYPYEDVDLNNLEKSVNDVVDFTVRKGIGRQLEALRYGFSEVFDISSLQIFSPMELKYMLCGPELSESC